jgi:hypothetical protein
VLNSQNQDYSQFGGIQINEPSKSSAGENIGFNNPSSIDYSQYGGNAVENKGPSINERMDEYNQLPWYEKSGFSPVEKERAKALISGATSGFSEYFDILKPDYEAEGTLATYGVGASLPIGLATKVAGKGFQALGNLFNFSSKGTAAGIAQSSTAGALYGTSKEASKAVRGEEIDPYAPLEEAALFGGTHFLLPKLIEGSKKAVDWVKSLNPKQQAQIFVDGILPKDLTPNEYIFLQNEIMPEWIESTENLQKKAYEAAKSEADNVYKQDLSIAKSNHEKELFETQQSNNLNAENFQQKKSDYENKLKQIAAEHELKIEKINKENEIAIKEYEEALEQFEEFKTRENIVQESTILKPGEENLPYRNSPSLVENPSLENEVGNVISKNEITTTTNAGKSQVEAVRANDAVDYANVNKNYEKSRKLNAEVETIHPNLVMEMMALRDRLRLIPQLDPVQSQQLQIAEAILEKTVKFGPQGSPIDFIPINNNVLADQAKAVRYFMDFGFEHGNTRGILSPLQRQIEESMSTAANITGHIEAAEANNIAKSSYAKWAGDYDNPYIRPYRDLSNKDYSKLFKRSLDTDEFNVIDNILQRSNSGQQISLATKRSLVNDKLGKFLDNPHAANGKEFEVALKELSSVLDNQQTNQIRELFKDAQRRKPNFSKKPKEPDLKAHPEKERIPLFNESRPTPKIVTEAKIPRSSFKETPEMKVLSQEAKMEVEELRSLSNSPSGLRKIKSRISQKSFDKLGKHKIKEIFQEGNIETEYTGKELYNIINKGKNYEIISEILGEEQASDLLEAAKKIADKRATVDALQKNVKKIAAIEAWLRFRPF